MLFDYFVLFYNYSIFLGRLFFSNGRANYLFTSLGEAVELEAIVANKLSTIFFETRNSFFISSMRSFLGSEALALFFTGLLKPSIAL